MHAVSKGTHKKRRAPSRNPPSSQLDSNPRLCGVLAVQGLVGELERPVLLHDPLLGLGYALIDVLGLVDISKIDCHSNTTTIGSGGSILYGPYLRVYVHSSLILIHVAAVHVLELLDTYVARTRGVHTLGARSGTARLLRPGGGACHQRHRQHRSQQHQLPQFLSPY